MGDELDSLLEEVKNIRSSLENNPSSEGEPAEPQITIPEKKWYHIADAISRNDELLEAILKAVMALKYPEVPAAPAPVPTPAPSPPTYPIPAEMGPKIDTLIAEMAGARKLLEGFAFKNGQAVVTSAGTNNSLIHDFKTYIVLIRANATNTGNIYIGDRGVFSGNGLILAPGEAFAIQIDVLKQEIYMDADVSGDGVSWITLV